MADSYNIDADPFEEEEDLVGEPELDEELEEEEEEDIVEGDDEFSYESELSKPIITQDTKRIADTQRRTPNFITPFERTALIGARAELLARGASEMIELTAEERKSISILDIARKEFEQGKIPFKIKRVIDTQSGAYEVWSINELVSARK